MKKFDKLLKKAKKNLQKKKFFKTVHYYNLLLEIKPNSAKLWSDLAFVHNLRGDYKPAIDAGNRALNIEPKFEEALNTLFFSYDKVGDYDNALKILKFYQKNYRLILHKSFEILKELVQPLSDAGYILNPSPKSKITLYYRGNETIGRIDIKNNRTYIDILLKYGSRYIIPLNFHYGFFFSRILTSKKRIDISKLVLEEFPHNIIVWNMLAEGYKDQNEYEKSLQALEKALEIKPKSSDSWGHIGLTYLEMNKYEEAVDAIKRAIEIDPEVSENWINLGIIFLKLNQIDNAIDALKHSLNIKSGKLKAIEQYLDSKALPKPKIKKLKYSFPIFNKIYNVDRPKYSWYYLAKAYYKKQDYEKALEACKESLAIDYKFDKVYKLKKKIISAKSPETTKESEEENIPERDVLKKLKNPGHCVYCSLIFIIIVIIGLFLLFFPHFAFFFVFRATLLNSTVEKPSKKRKISLINTSSEDLNDSEVMSRKDDEFNIKIAIEIANNTKINNFNIVAVFSFFRFMKKITLSPVIIRFTNR